MKSDFYSFTAQNNRGEEVSMEVYRGKTVLLVNTASKCGFTPQYRELQELYDQYGEWGLAVLGFPCDQFAHQESGSDEEIAQFCSLNYGVTFPIFHKVEVNGSGAHPLFKYLKGTLPGRPGKRIKWNFTKFLIGPDGTPVKRYPPRLHPSRLSADIEVLLEKKPLPG